jgi:hypothetical protein
MLTTRHPVDFPYMSQELEALLDAAQVPDVAPEFRHERRSTVIPAWSRDPLVERMGAVACHWAPAPRLYEIETAEGFTLAKLLQEFGRLELKALGPVKHGDLPEECHETTL